MAAANELTQMPREAYEPALVGALRQRQGRIAAAWLLCYVDPERPVEPIVTASRRAEGRDAEPYEAADAEELIRLGLHVCPCTGLCRLELFSSMLADRKQKTSLRASAAGALGTVDDPKAAEALRAGARDRNLVVRFMARLALGLPSSRA